MVLGHGVTTFHVVCAICHSAAISTWQVRTRSSANLPERAEPGVFSASTTAMPTRLSRRPAELSDKLAICQQQTPPWSRCGDWRSSGNHLAVENYGPPLFTSSRIHHIIYTKCLEAIPLPTLATFGNGRCYIRVVI